MPKNLKGEFELRIKSDTKPFECKAVSSKLIIATGVKAADPLPSLPDGVDALKARIMQLQAVSKQLTTARDTMTDTNPRVEYLVGKLAELHAPIDKAIVTKLSELADTDAKLANLYKPNHPQRKALLDGVAYLKSSQSDVLSAISSQIKAWGLTQAYAKLMAQAKLTLSKTPVDPKKLTEAQKAELRRAQKMVAVALVYKPADREGLALKERLAAYFGLALDLGKGETLKLTLISAGKFQMGSPKSEPGRQDDEGPQREVTISNPFYMGIYEITQAQWKAVMGTEPWAGEKYATSGGGNAASYISWADATKFCEALSKKTGKKVTLPTEAQWEYACRAGSKTAYNFADDSWSRSLVDYAWYDKSAYEKGEKYAHAVGQKKPNAFGLYDMHGNVTEWCSDRYDEKFYAKAKNVDPENTTKAKFRVFRGGSWDDDCYDCRAADRCWSTTVSRSSGMGFRVVVACGQGVD